MVDNIAVMDHGIPPPSVPSRPRMVNSNIYTIDITDKFRSAASKLPAGTLIKDEQFTLFESVGALEIGDPKMDSGCVEEGESLDVDFDVCQPLSPNELIWLMDEMLSREVAWHMGYPLSQTLFTSVYIERLLWPDPIKLQEARFSSSIDVQNADPLLHQVFRSYCLGLVKSCDLVLGMVTSQHYYEEEDFATQLYNRELLHRFSVDAILLEMQASLQCLSTAFVSSAEKRNLEARVNFRLKFLTMLSSHTALSETPFLNSTFDKNLLDTIQASKDSGKPLPESFTLKIQRRLVSTVPPRPMVTIDEQRTFDYLRRFIQDCQNVTSVLSAAHSHDLLTSYALFCGQDPQPSVYVRALLQSWLSREDLIGGLANETEFIANDMRSLTCAASPIVQTIFASSNNLGDDLKLVRQHLTTFIEKHSRSFLNLWRTACLNRSRVRRTLCHAALEWDQIQAEAEELDDELQRLTMETALIYPVGGAPTFSYSLSSWMYHYKLTQIQMIVHTGFEQDIYAPHELSSMYYYLSYLCDAHLAHLERISFFVAQRKTAPSPMLRSLGQQNSSQDECRASLQHLYRHFGWLKTTEAMTKALHYLYVVLQRHGQMQEPEITYASDRLRYELRMRPFLHLSIPEPLDFDHCMRLSRMEVRNDLEILEEAASCVALAKKGWEDATKKTWNAFPLRSGSEGGPSKLIAELWTQNIRGVVRASISTSLAITALRKHLESKEQQLHASFKAVVPQKGDKDYWHPWWLVPRLTFRAE